MKHRFMLIYVLALLSKPSFSQLYINEIGANNETTIADTQGEFDDWIEIYNAGNTAVNLADHYFSDDLNNPTKWEIPATNANKTTVPSNGYLLLWADEQIADGEDHVDFSLNSSGETVYLFATNGTSLIDSLNYPSLSNDISFGRSTDGNTQVKYFSAPTPLATNVSSVDVLINFSELSQTFIGSLSVTLSTVANNGVLRYTTNGNEPTSNSPVYNDAISITNNTVLKVKYFFNNGIISNTVTHRYVRMSSNMSNISSDLPIFLIDTYGQTLNSTIMQNAFCSIIEPDNTGRAYANGLSTFSGKTGMRIRGASSSNFPKKQWRVEFRNEDDTDKKVGVGNLNADSDWVLYAPGRYDRALINNPLMYELSRRLGYWAPSTQFVEVYYNEDGGDLSTADYWGIYILTEKIEINNDRLDIAKPDLNEDTLKSWLSRFDRDIVFTTPYSNSKSVNWQRGYDVKDPSSVSLSSVQVNIVKDEIIAFENRLLDFANHTDPVLSYKNVADNNSFALAHILKGLSKEPDGFAVSNYVYKENDIIYSGPIWDFDRAINSPDVRSSDPLGWDAGNAHYWKTSSVWRSLHINELVEDPDYETLVYDYWFNWRRNDVLQTSVINNIIDSLANILSESQVRNFNRWNTTDYAPRYGGFWGEVDAMKTWLSDRSNWMDSQFISNPAISPVGGNITPNQNISINNTYGSGTIYYTTDGSDPRLSGGAINTSASTYNGSFTITQPGITYVTARIKNGNSWGAVCQIAFYVADNYQDIVINEIHYNPTDAGLVDGDQFEFIELKNKSNNSVNLTGLQFTDGIKYTFPAGSVLPANGFIVLADDSLEFINQYGFSPDGNYGGNLSNAGEQVVLSDYYGNNIDVVLYDDVNPWQTAADGTGPSLGLIDATTNNAQAANWGIQTVQVSPKAENTFCDGSLTYNVTQANVSCNGSNDGFISGNGTGGNTPYTYQWNNGTNSNNITNLTPGVYALTLTDDFGCSFTKNYEITEPAALTATITQTDQSYYQTNDGTASISVSGGTNTYTYSWSNGATTSSISNLSPGTYSVDVLDAVGCLLSKSVTIQAIDCSSFNASTSKTNETYYQTNDGTASVAVSGSTTNYTYSWSNGATTSSISNLSPGTYSVDVLDAVGCLLSESVTIQAIDCSSFNASTSKTNETYYQANDGTVSVSLSGGLAPYTYNWSNGANSASLNNLAPGNYSVDVLDAVGCPLSKSITIQAIDCSALTASISKTDESYYQANDGTVSVSLSGGLAPYTYNWSNGANSASLNNLAPGNYSVVAIDAIGCPINKSITIDSISCSPILVDVEIINETCEGQGNGLLIIKSISNGIASHSILWSTGITGTVANNLTAGSYQLNVTDVNGCPFQESFTVETGNIIQASFTINNVSSATLNDGSIEAMPSGGDAPYTFNWSNGSTSQNLVNVGEGIYSVIITDANGCSEFLDQLAIGNGCMSSITQQDKPIINSRVYQAAQFIQSNGIVNTNEQVSFKAGDYIELNSDFEVTLGAEFEAKIDGCE